MVCMMKELLIWWQEKILVLAPHPDDESIWCWWLLLKYSTNCDVIVLTDGCYWGKSNQSLDKIVADRQCELAQAMEYCGIENYSFLNIQDSCLCENFTVFAQIDLSKYDKIFCPSPNDNHQDHKCVYWFISRMKHTAQVFGYEVRSTLNDPSHYIDISDIIELKKTMINFHTSQVEQVDYVNKIIWLNCYRWIQVYPAIPYAEVYRVL